MFCVGLSTVNSVAKSAFEDLNNGAATPLLVFLILVFVALSNREFVAAHVVITSHFCSFFFVVVDVLRFGISPVLGDTSSSISTEFKSVQSLRSSIFVAGFSLVASAGALSVLGWSVFESRGVSRRSTLVR